MADSMAHRFGSSPGWAASTVLLDEAAANSVGFDGANRQQALMSVLVQIDKAHQFAVAA